MGGVGSPGCAGGATGADSTAGAAYFHPSNLKVDPNFGADGRAVNVPDVALAFTLGAADSVAGAVVGASYFHCLDKGSIAVGGAVNILGAAPVLAFTLGVRAGAESSAVGAGALAALAALSLAALY